MGIVSALFATIFSILNGNFTKHHNALVITFYEMAGALLGIVLFACLRLLFAENQTLPTCPDGNGLGLYPDFGWYLYGVCVRGSREADAKVFGLCYEPDNQLRTRQHGIILAFLIFWRKGENDIGLLYRYNDYFGVRCCRTL